MKIDRQQLEETYRSMTDEELLRMAADAEALTEEASRLLGYELQRRHFGEPDIAPYREEHARIVAEKSQDLPPEGLTFLVGLLFGSIGRFLFEALWGTSKG